MIENKFLMFKTYNGFLRQLNAGNIQADSIVFIQDKSMIWTHGTEYHCDNNQIAKGIIANDGQTFRLFDESGAVTGYIKLNNYSGNIEINDGENTISAPLSNYIGIKGTYAALPDVENFENGDIIAVGTNDSGYNVYYYNANETEYYDNWYVVFDGTLNKGTDNIYRILTGKFNFGVDGLIARIFIDGDEILGDTGKQLTINPGISSTDFFDENNYTIFNFGIDVTKISNQEKLDYQTFVNNINNDYQVTELQVEGVNNNPVVRIVISTNKKTGGWINLGKLGISSLQVTQSIGQSTTSVMSQYAATSSFITANQLPNTEEDAKYSIDVDAALTNNAVRYTEQYRNENEKAQARANIGAASQIALDDLIARVDQLENNNLTIIQ